MRNTFKILIFSIILSACVDDNENTPITDSPSVEIGESEIPYIIIQTEEQIQNEPKIPAVMRIFDKKILTQRATIGIEYRGSTSYRLSNKKSFGIETWDDQGNDVDNSFFGFPLEEDWIMQGHVINTEQMYAFDRTLIYNHVGYRLFENMGHYSSRTQFVELELNGEYLGVYVFMEKLKRDNNRIDISRLDPGENDPENITGGYILKIDKTSGGDLNLNQPLEYFDNNWDDDARYSSDISFRSQYDIFGREVEFAPFSPPYHPNQYLETYFLYEYPKAADISPQQKEYIQTYINDFETALVNEDYSGSEREYLEYIDLDSFVDFFIINEVCRNIDGYRLSTWMYKDKGEKLKMGPIWDLNIGFDSGDRIPEDDWVVNYNNYVSQDAWMMPFWWPKMLQDPVFRDALKVRWNELRSGILSDGSVLALVDEATSFLTSNGAVKRNYDKWVILPPVNHSQSVLELRTFLTRRLNWMDGEIGSF